MTTPVSHKVAEIPAPFFLAIRALWLRKLASARPGNGGSPGPANGARVGARGLAATRVRALRRWRYCPLEAAPAYLQPLARARLRQPSGRKVGLALGRVS